MKNQGNVKNTSWLSLFRMFLKKKSVVLVTQFCVSSKQHQKKTMIMSWNFFFYATYLIPYLYYLSIWSWIYLSIWSWIHLQQLPLTHSKIAPNQVETSKVGILASLVCPKCTVRRGVWPPLYFWSPPFRYPPLKKNFLIPPFSTKIFYAVYQALYTQKATMCMFV